MKTKLYTSGKSKTTVAVRERSMIQQSWKIPTLIGTVIISGVALTGSPAYAFQWSVTQDSSTDGYDYGRVGSSSQYEILNAGFAQDDKTVALAVGGNLPLAGVSNPAAKDGNVGYGAWFLNFSGKSIREASDLGLLLAIVFAGNGEASLFGNVKATSNTADNDGFSSYARYNTAVTRAGGSPSAGALSATDAYWGNLNDPILNVMASGTKLGNATLLGASALNGSGLTGNHQFGFSVSKALLPTGNFIASLWAECGNDGIAVRDSVTATEAVPEPSSILGAIVVGGAAISRKFRRAKSPQ